MIPPIIVALFILIMMPYLIKIFTLKNNATLLSDDQKDQLFFFSLGYAYTVVGLFIIGYFFLNHFMVVLMWVIIKGLMRLSDYLKEKTCLMEPFQGASMHGMCFG